MNFKNSLLSLLFMSSLSLTAVESHASLSLAVNDKGTGISFLVTGPKRVGFFVGYSGENNEKNRPTPAYFNWINYNNEAVLSKSWLTGGVAFSVNEHISFGVGYANSTVKTYKSGVGYTGLMFSIDGNSSSESAIIYLVEVGVNGGICFQAYSSKAGSGGSVGYRW